MSNVNIISNGTPTDTKIIVGGVTMEGVIKIEIDPITPNADFVTAIVTIEGFRLGDTE